MTARSPKAVLGPVLASVLLAIIFIAIDAGKSSVSGLFLPLFLLVLVAAVWTVRACAALDGRPIYGLLTAGLFGLWLLYFWQLLVTAYEVPRVLLPSPWLIVQAMAEGWRVLWGDFVNPC